jgi:hypothetical protein
LAVAGVLLKMEPVCLVGLEGEQVVLGQFKPADQLLLDRVMWVEIRKTPERFH